MSTVAPETTRVSFAGRFAGVLVGGSIAGVLDIIYAFVMAGQNGRSPMWVLQSVASGLLGANAYQGGYATGGLGLVCHFIVALGAASVYYWVTLRQGTFRRHACGSGAVFGIGVYLVMNFVVLPLSAFPAKLAYPAAVLARGFLSHAVLVGLPIALSVRYFSRKN